jgi:transcriptional regulator GlxA family with amidase domain
VKISGTGRVLLWRGGSLWIGRVGEHDPRIDRAIEALRRRLGDAVRLSDVAAAVHLSPERFRHFFLEQTGMRRS